jgi:pimeloyl-ACP methyl ester carboxylesterase
VIDLEVSNSTPSPTVDPSVHVVLVGHSMGGIVAAETAISIAAERPITASQDLSDPDTAFMFPRIHGVLAFDTPYLGIAPGVVAHGAEGSWNKVSGAWGAYQSLTAAFGGGSAATAGAGAGTAAGPEPSTLASSRMMSSATSSSSDPDADVAAAPAWQRWGRYAMYAGAAGAVVAGGAAAYAKRNELSQGVSSGVGWVGSHLEFVGCLARAAELEERVRAVERLVRGPFGVGFADFYTALGEAARREARQQPGMGWAAKAVGDDRTFCVLPKSGLQRFFVRATNDAATTETSAHMNMFTPKLNPGFYDMSERARDLVTGWVLQTSWYETGEEKAPLERQEEEGVEIVDPPKVADDYVDLGTEAWRN